MRASFRYASISSGRETRSGRGTLIATGRSRSSSKARKTSPNPPFPSVRGSCNDRSSGDGGARRSPGNPHRRNVRPQLMRGSRVRPSLGPRTTTDLFHDREGQCLIPSLLLSGSRSLASPHDHPPRISAKSTLADPLDSEQIVHRTIGSSCDDSPGEGWTDPRQRLQFGRRGGVQIDEVFHRLIRRGSRFDESEEGRYAANS